MLRIGEVIKLFGYIYYFHRFVHIFVSNCPKNMFFSLFWRDFLGLFTTRFGPVLSPAGPGPGHLGSGPVQTWVCQDQDRTLDSLCAACSDSALRLFSSESHLGSDFYFYWILSMILSASMQTLPPDIALKLKKEHENKYSGQECNVP